METKGLGAGSYPEPKEEKTKLINIHINIQYAINDLEVPSKWSFEDIQEAFGQNALAITGDVTLDCTVDVSDAVLLARFCTEDSTAVITDQGKQNADVNDSGNIDLDDVTAILRKIAKLD